MPAYYNEIEPYAAQWLRNLIDAGHIAPGDVDERDIRDVRPEDLRGYEQCHFFAGIGVWSLALRRAGWPDDRPVWTGSCPCQPFSAAGAGLGFSDERHLWPHWHWLISECRPPVVIGEQVAAASEWLELVRSNLEAVGYAMAAIPVEAASAGADHFRDRYWLVAYDDQQLAGEAGIQRGREQRWPSGHPEDRVRALVNNSSLGWGEGWTESELRRGGLSSAIASIDGGQYIECPDGKWRRLPPPRVRWLGNGIPSRVAKLRAIGNAIDPRPATALIESMIECLPA